MFVVECEQPNYVSKNGKIVAVYADNSEVQIDIKGVNWLGMEDSKGVPKGLWDNTREGSTMVGPPRTRSKLFACACVSI